MEVIQQEIELEGGKELCKNICKWIKNLSPPAHANILGSLGDIFRSRNPNGTDRGLERWKCKDSLGSCDQRLLLLSFSLAVKQQRPKCRVPWTPCAFLFFIFPLVHQEPQGSAPVLGKLLERSACCCLLMLLRASEGSPARTSCGVLESMLAYGPRGRARAGSRVGSGVYLGPRTPGARDWRPGQAGAPLSAALCRLPLGWGPCYPQCLSSPPLCAWRGRDLASLVLKLGTQVPTAGRPFPTCVLGDRGHERA